MGKYIPKVRFLLKKVCICQKKAVILCPEMMLFMEEGRVFEEMYQTIDRDEMAVLRDVNRFPVYGKDVISPCMMVCINHPV